MKIRVFAIVIVLMTACVLLFSGCRDKGGGDPEPKTGKLRLSFTHLVKGVPLVLDNVWYVNEAGNQYNIDQLMYFISDVKLYKNDGSVIIIDDWKDIHYADVEIPSTLSWDVFDPIPSGTYDSIGFTFGISQEKNQSFMYVNAPEVNMMWPDVLGGGYHYLMINGKWKDLANIEQPFNFHLGIGQLYKSNVINTDSIYAFVQNYFYVSLPNSSFTIETDKTRQIELIMNIESWFKTPHVYDHNVWGGGIMQNQPAMQMAKENGYDVFSIGINP